MPISSKSAHDDLAIQLRPVVLNKLIDNDSPNKYKRALKIMQPYVHQIADVKFYNSSVTSKRLQIINKSLAHEILNWLDVYQIVVLKHQLNKFTKLNQLIITELTDSLYNIAKQSSDTITIICYQLDTTIEHLEDDRYYVNGEIKTIENHMINYWDQLIKLIQNYDCKTEE